MQQQFKTQPSKGEADRAARRARAEAERRACDLEEQRERAEQELARARLAELSARNEELGRYVTEQQRRVVDEEIAERERREQLMQEARRLVNEPLPTVPRSREEYQAEIDALGRYLDRHQQAEQDRLWRETDAALTRRTWDWSFRRSWDARHPGGPDHCPCDGCRAWRREPPR
jgi:hypothetical protein